MKTIDVKGGQITFSQRIELGQLISDKTLSAFDRYEACMRCIDPRYNSRSLRQGLLYYEELLQGIQYWVNRENTELDYKPSPDEIAAGIGTLSKSVGYMGTIMALAKDYGVDPDVVLQWKYGKVFNILYTNLQNALYRERLDKRMAEKARVSTRRR